MKRKITDLEKNLINKGFVLKEKKYAGKHSEKTASYVYEGIYTPYLMIINLNVVVILNAKRDKVLNIGIVDPLKVLGVNYIDFKSAKLLGLFIDEITHFIYGVKDKEKDADETVEIVEEIENETEGTEAD